MVVSVGAQESHRPLRRREGELEVQMWPVFVRGTPDICGRLEGLSFRCDRDQGGETRSPQVAGMGWED